MANMYGGIIIPESPIITDEHKRLVEEARKSLLDGNKVTPQVLLGMQLVAGTNYWILCMAEGLSPEGGKNGWSIRSTKILKTMFR
ncbi:hypothetical protein [Enterococcus sp. DIV0170]|uniref:hypothetical protein n=1 Tax=Enterococcus sp. DIV0170 TaxID=2774642 RepID=UPI003F28CD7C